MKILKKVPKTQTEKKAELPEKSEKIKKSLNFKSQKAQKTVRSKKTENTQKRVGSIKELAVQGMDMPVIQEDGLPLENAHTYLPKICVSVNTVPTALMAFASGAEAIQVSFLLGAEINRAVDASDFLSQKDIHSLACVARAEGRYIFVNLSLATGINVQDIVATLDFFVSIVNPYAFVLEDVALAPLLLQLGFAGMLCASPALQYHNGAALQQARSFGIGQIYLPSAITATELATLHQTLQVAGQKVHQRAQQTAPQRSLKRTDAEKSQGVISLAPDVHSLSVINGDIARSTRELEDSCTPEFTLHIHGTMDFCAEGACRFDKEKSCTNTCAGICQQEFKAGGRSGLFFACLDLALEASVRPLQAYEHVTMWLIKAHNRTPHYVDHVVRAYLLLRDHGKESEARKEAERLFSFALGRQGVKAGFMSESGGSGHKKTPLALAHGSSTILMGRYCGKVAGVLRSFTLTPAFDLLAGDVLCIGEKAENTVITVQASALASHEMPLRFAGGRYPKIGTSVFLVNREEISAKKALGVWRKKTAECAKAGSEASNLVNNWAHSSSEKTGFGGSTLADIVLPTPIKGSTSAQNSAKKKAITRIAVVSSLPVGKGRTAFTFEKDGGPAPGSGKNEQSLQGLWLSKKAIEGISKTLVPRLSWWLPPLIWPEEERFWLRLIREAQQKGARYFVCNSFSQTELFKQERWSSARNSERSSEPKKLMLSAGPFCHITTPFAVNMAEKLGFSTLFVSPSLSVAQMCDLAPYATVKLGIVDGYVPLSLSRYALGTGKSPLIFEKAYEPTLWARRYGGTTWVYSDVVHVSASHEKKLLEAGYTIFANLQEHLPYELVKKAKEETLRDKTEQKIQRLKEQKQEKMEARRDAQKAKRESEARKKVIKDAEKKADKGVSRNASKGTNKRTGKGTGKSTEKGAGTGAGTGAGKGAGKSMEKGDGKDTRNTSASKGNMKSSTTGSGSKGLKKKSFGKE